MITVMQKLGWFFKQEWKRYTLAISLLVITSILEVVPPMLVGKSIDSIQLGALTWAGVTQTLLLLLGITIVTYWMNYVWFYKLFGGAVTIERLMRSRLMRHFLKMTPTFFERNRTGDLMARATNDLQAVAQTAGIGILTLFDSTI